MRRLVALLIVLALAGSSAAALCVAAPAASAHACCKVRMESAHRCHTTTLSCCKPAPQPDRQSTVPPVSGSLVGAPELIALFNASLPPDAMAAAQFALMARAEARFKSPPDPVYLRNAVLLV